MSTEKIGKETESTVLPVISNEVYCLFGESLILMPEVKNTNGRKYRPFYGIGIVYRVVRGESQDLIYIKFGALPTVKTRVVYVYDNHSRRQLLTLKRGQCCQIFGMARYYSTKITLNGKETKGTHIGLYAKGVNGWYVPTMMDIRKMPSNEDLVPPTDKEKDLQKTLEEVLEDFYNEN